MSYRKMLIAVDGSEYALNAARRGIELAHLLRSEVSLLFVVDTRKAIGNVDAGISHEDALLILKKEAEQTLDQVDAMYGDGAAVKLMPEGHPRQEIIKTAEAWEADLIVVGTHGRQGLMHLLLGSSAEYIVRHSKVPVMVVPLK
jgi:nucleotide-binding universal stress UspA family protein